MSTLFISYLIVFISSTICVFIGRKLLHPKNPIFVILCYLGFVVFLLGRFYEISRIILELDLYNDFELGFIGIIGAFSFWLSSCFAVKDEVNIKTNKSVMIKSLITSCLVGLLYFVILFGNVTNMEKVIDLIVDIYACSVVYYYTRSLLLIKEDKSNKLRGIKLYCILGIIFSILVLLLAISFAYSSDILLLLVSIIMSNVLLAMMIVFKKGVKEWKTMN